MCCRSCCPESRHTPQYGDKHMLSQAFANVLKRMLEASGRGMWNADEATLEKLRSMYEDVDAQLEGVR